VGRSPARLTASPSSPQAKQDGNIPYANNAGIRIHYEVKGSGPTLVLQHGFTQCLADWSECGYLAPLRPRYRVILVDARGHGGSDKPHDAASYTLDRRAADVTTVLDALGVEKAHFWGYSMGGWIGFGVAKYAPHRVDALVIGGQHPFARDQASFRQMIREGIASGGNAFVAAVVKIAGPISDAYAARLRSADLQAYLAAAQDRVGIGDVLGTMAMPCCVYAGRGDPMFSQTKLASEQIPNARFFSLPGLSHLQAFVESGCVLPLVMEFLDAAR
jgi:pimeloyl-ACP methyl ester carboxylesterase